MLLLPVLECISFRSGNSQIWFRKDNRGPSLLNLAYFGRRLRAQFIGESGDRLRAIILPAFIAGLQIGRQLRLGDCGGVVDPRGESGLWATSVKLSHSMKSFPRLESQTVGVTSQTERMLSKLWPVVDFVPPHSSKAPLSTGRGRGGEHSCCDQPRGFTHNKQCIRLMVNAKEHASRMSLRGHGQSIISSGMISSNVQHYSHQLQCCFASSRGLSCLFELHDIMRRLCSLITY